MRGCNTSPLIFRLRWRSRLGRSGGSPRHWWDFWTLRAMKNHISA